MCREWQRQVDAMTVGRRVGMLWMDLTDAQAALRRTLERAMATLCLVLEVSSHNRLTEALAGLQAALRRVRDRPEALLAFSEYLADLTDIQAREEALLAAAGAVKVRVPSLCRTTPPRATPIP